MEAVTVYRATVAVCAVFAGKLSVPVEVVRHGVEGLMYLMTQSSKHMVPCPLSHITLVVCQT